MRRNRRACRRHTAIPTARSGNCKGILLRFFSKLQFGILRKLDSKVNAGKNSAIYFKKDVLISEPSYSESIYLPVGEIKEYLLLETEIKDCTTRGKNKAFYPLYFNFTLYEIINIIQFYGFIHTKLLTVVFRFWHQI